MYISESGEVQLLTQRPVLLTLSKLVQIGKAGDDSQILDPRLTEGNGLNKIEKIQTTPPPKEGPVRRFVSYMSGQEARPSSRHNTGLDWGKRYHSRSFGNEAEDSIPLGKDAIRTLQRYRGGPNIERADFMERKSALFKKSLAVSVEQVSIFLTTDNTIISFFEHSADDIEVPILKRLASDETILRISADASMMTQAVIDAIIDLALPVISAYEDVIDDLELDVLTDTSLRHSRELCTSVKFLLITWPCISKLSASYVFIKQIYRCASCNLTNFEHRHPNFRAQYTPQHHLAHARAG